jgi:hypothetical protein
LNNEIAPAKQDSAGLIAIEGKKTDAGENTGVIDH